MPNFRFTFTASVTIDAKDYDEACQKYGELELFSDDAKKCNVEFGDTYDITDTDNDHQYLC
jgi:hypothetical protein